MRRVFQTLAIVAAGVLAAGLFPLHGLEVRESGGAGRVLLLQRVSPGDTFALSFVHSVEKSDVTDHFRIDDGYRIILYETEFRSLNTGLPAVVSEGEVFERTGGGFRLSNRRQLLPEIRLQVTEAWGGTLSVKGREIFLPALAGDGPVTISVQRVFAWELLLWAFRT
ncbi:MAG: DUF1850 domain-containing protein [Syntrophaceae bacterium]|nr:DUF1850 domain-containing protein [Syntrophaceae bacterium]